MFHLLGHMEFFKTGQKRPSNVKKRAKSYSGNSLPGKSRTLMSSID